MKVAISSTLVLASLLFVGCAAVETSSQAAQASVQAVGYSGAASAQAVSAVLAVPFKAVGAVGAVSSSIADGLDNAASGNKFKVSDDIVVGEPPYTE